jgi:hypothetical protein
MSYEDRRAQDKREDEELAQALAQLENPMPLTAEWRVVLALLRGGWPGSPTQADQLAFRTFLGDLPPGDVARALRDLARGGARYRPTPSEVRTAVLGLDSETAPTFDEAWQLVVDTGRANGWREDEALAVLLEVSRPVGAWAQMRGLRKLWHLPTEDPEHGRFVLRDLAASYDAFREAWAIPARREQLAAPRAEAGLRRLTYGATSAPQLPESGQG